MDTPAVGSVLLDHLAAVTPPDQLDGIGVRHLREPTNPASSEHRGLGPFVWLPPSQLHEAPGMWAEGLTPELVALWRWVDEDCGGPQRAARCHFLHGVRIPGALMLRAVTCATRPARGAGRLAELTGVLGLPIDLDVRERRPGDHRRYCPTIVEGLRFLGRFAPSVVLDAGGGLVGVWLFDGPADPHQARQLGHDLLAAIGRATRAEGWCFDSPPPHAAWIKVPGCLDLFRQHVTAEVAAGSPWRFAELRAAVPPSGRRRPHRHYQPQGDDQ